MHEQIGSLILIHAMTIHYDIWAFLYLGLHNNNLLYCNPVIFYIWNVCLLLRIPVCVLSRVYVRCGPTYRHMLLTRSLNNKEILRHWL